MRRRHGVAIAVVVALIAALSSRRTALHLGGGVRSTRPPAAVTSNPPAPAAPGPRADIGFATPEKLTEHWRKHGREFGVATEEEYLRRAQALRDAAAGGGVLEGVQAGGRIIRFDRTSGAFIAFDPDSTIRTYFRPNDGEAYFRRKLRRSDGE